MKTLSIMAKGFFLTGLIIVGLFIIVGCEGYSCAQGTIYDKNSNEPLDSVLCKVLTGSHEEFSDSIGQYAVCNDFGGCVPKCPDITVEFSKDGYKSQTKTGDFENIYLEKK